MRTVTFRNKNVGTSVRAQLGESLTFGAFVLERYEPRMGTTYVIRANTGGGDTLVTVKSDEAIPKLVTIIEIESCAKC